MKIPILIVDDHKENLLALESLLCDAEREIVCVHSGEEATAKIRGREYALVVMTTRMSHQDGYETARRMYSACSERRIPMILITSDGAGRKHIWKGSRTGIIDYLFRPFEPQLLLSKVSAFLELYRVRVQLAEAKRELDAKSLELEVLQKELEEKNETFELASSLDSLTGLFNRRYFNDNLLKECKQAVRNNSRLALLFIDVDDFKTFNARYGEQEGDSCLRKVAMALYEALMRPVDIVARYDNARFSAILPETDDQGALLVATRMMASVAQLKIPHAGAAASEWLTVSIGGASLLPDNINDSATLLDRAAEALVAAIKGGRNRHYFNS